MREKHRLSLLKQTSSIPGTEERRKSKKSKRFSLNVVSSSGYAKKLQRAGIPLSPRIYGALALMISVGVWLVVSLVGMLLSTVLALACLHYLLFGYLEERSEKRKKQIIPQLAPFIDGITSALTTGFNIEGAIAQAADGVPAGLLKTELDRVVVALDRGFSVKEAMSLLRDRLSGREVTSLVVALTLFSSMGGYVLEPFKRLAQKIRDQQAVMEKANRDLVMVKQAFYIIFFLAVGAPVVLLMIQPEYLKNAFNDVLGHLVLQGGALMILGSYLFFKKITNLRI